MIMAEIANDFIRQGGDKPFFLLASYADPHQNLENIKKGPLFIEQVSGVPEKPLGYEDVEPFDFLGIDTPEIRQEVAGYYNSVARVDYGIGLLLDALAKAGYADNTLVIAVPNRMKYSRTLAE